MATGVEPDALVYLLRDASCSAAIGGGKGFAGTEGAAPEAKGAVAVGTDEAAVHCDFLHGAAEAFAAIVGIGEVGGAHGV